MSSSKDHAEQLKHEKPLKELLIRELARLHKNDKMSYDQLHTLISDNYLDHHAYDWYQDRNAMGAFAFFRPQQFSEMWNKMIQPSGNFVVIGEAASPHHAWVVGALESAIHGVYTWLGANPKIPGAEAARAILKTPVQGNPYVGLPPYMEPNAADWHSSIAIARMNKHMQDKEQQIK